MCTSIRPLLRKLFKSGKVPSHITYIYKEKKELVKVFYFIPDI